MCGGRGDTHVYMRLSLLFILFFVVPVDNDLLLLAANTFICSVQEEKSSPLRPAFCSAVCKRIPFAPMINNLSLFRPTFCFALCKRKLSLLFFPLLCRSFGQRFVLVSAGENFIAYVRFSNNTRFFSSKDSFRAKNVSLTRTEKDSLSEGENIY